MKKEIIQGSIIVILLTLSFMLGYAIKQYTSEIVESDFLMFKELKQSRLQQMKEDNLNLSSKLHKASKELLSYKSVESNFLIDMEDYKKINEPTAVIVSRCIISLALKYGIEPELLYAIVASESSFDLQAKHKHKDVKGFTGIHTGFWLDSLVEAGILANQGELNIACVSIEASAYILRELLIKEGGIEKTIRSYKGWGAEGKVHTQRTLKIYNRLKGE